MLTHSPESLAAVVISATCNRHTFFPEYKSRANSAGVGSIWSKVLATQEKMITSCGGERKIRLANTARFAPISHEVRGEDCQADTTSQACVPYTSYRKMVILSALHATNAERTKVWVQLADCHTCNDEHQLRTERRFSSITRVNRRVAAFRIQSEKFSRSFFYEAFFFFPLPRSLLLLFP